MQLGLIGHNSVWVGGKGDNRNAHFIKEQTVYLLLTCVEFSPFFLGMIEWREIFLFDLLILQELKPDMHVKISLRSRWEREKKRIWIVWFLTLTIWLYASKMLFSGSISTLSPLKFPHFSFSPRRLFRQTIWPTWQTRVQKNKLDLGRSRTVLSLFFWTHFI